MAIVGSERLALQFCCNVGRGGWCREGSVLGALTHARTHAHTHARTHTHTHTHIYIYGHIYSVIHIFPENCVFPQFYSKMAKQRGSESTPPFWVLSKKDPQTHGENGHTPKIPYKTRYLSTFSTNKKKTNKDLTHELFVLGVNILQDS